PNIAAGSSIGTAGLPLSDLFVGSGGANKALDFDTSTLTANRQVKWVDAAGTVVETGSGINQPLQTRRGVAGCVTGASIGAACFSISEPTLHSMILGEQFQTSFRPRVRKFLQFVFILFKG